jgi:glycolate oxidase FAD binding subunit
MGDRAAPEQSPVHTKRTGDRPAHRTPAEARELTGDAFALPGHRTPAQAGESGSESSDGRADADGGAAVGPFRVVRPLAGGRGGPATLLRVSFWAGKLVDVLGAIRGAAGQHRLDPAIGGSAAAGVLEVVVGEGAAADAVAGFVADLRASLGGLSAGSVLPAAASAVVLHAPPAVRDAVDMWGPVQSPELMRAVKDQFDPDNRMAPGRLPGGI